MSRNSDKEEGREKRGFVSPDLINRYANVDDELLIKMINSSLPNERTLSAALIAERGLLEAIPLLCKQLSVENKLYPKIAISEALSKFGTNALPELLKYIGKIGKNQHHTISEKNFNKFSYPLPRDIIARTISNMGDKALPHLLPLLNNSEKYKINEIIDAIGFISFYSEDKSAFEALYALYKVEEDVVTKWKLIRAFSAFQNVRGAEVCLNVALNQDENEGLRAEAVRTLYLCSGTIPQEIIALADKTTSRVSEMITSVQKRIK